MINFSTSKDAENGTTKKGHKGAASWREASSQENSLFFQCEEEFYLCVTRVPQFRGGGNGDRK
jgi:hypothetical protein